jgi:hypothetical protein
MSRLPARWEAKCGDTQPIRHCLTHEGDDNALAADVETDIAVGVGAGGIKRLQHAEAWQKKGGKLVEDDGTSTTSTQAVLVCSLTAFETRFNWQYFAPVTLAWRQGKHDHVRMFVVLQ